MAGKPELLLEEYGTVMVTPLGVITDPRMGPMPMIEWSKKYFDYIEHSYVILRKVNSAIAWMLVRGKAKQVYTKTLTHLSEQIFDHYGITYEAEMVEEELSDDELCQWEFALKGVDDPDKAWEIILESSGDTSFPHVGE